MSGEIKVPSLGESVSEAVVAKWFKTKGDAVTKDEPIVELETDKVTLEVNAPESGVLSSIEIEEEGSVEVGALLGRIDVGATNGKTASKQETKQAPEQKAQPQQSAAPAASANGRSDIKNPPAVEKMLAENPQVNPANVSSTGKDGRLTKGDVMQALKVPGGAPAQAGPREERVKMTKLRQAIAKRLKDSQNTAAILTTFNEIDMTNVMAMRKEYKDSFEKRFGVRLGFMGFFVKSAIQALLETPEVNAQIDGNEIVYKNYYDIGVAVGTEQGLVVPVIRDADRLGIAEVEAEIGRLAGKARDGALSMEELSGGTFTISNGGVYGSLLATPIINPPQSGILGLHRIEERPVVVDGQIVVRPMMYVALSYDHRIIDGRESVTFLKRIKECMEDPARLLLGV